MPCQRVSSLQPRLIDSAVFVVMAIGCSSVTSSSFRPHELVVGGDRQELLHGLCRREGFEDLGGPVEPPGAPACVSNLLPYCRELLVAHLREQAARDGTSVLEPGAVPDPLPDLRPRDLGRGGVLHEVVERN